MPKFFAAVEDPGSGAFLTLDPGSEMEKYGSGIRDGKIRIRDLESKIRDKHCEIK
jgi:hypothetical protein